VYKEKLSGLFAPVATPFDDDRLRTDWLAENLDKLAETKLRGYLALGSNGEFRSLSWEEQREVLTVFAKHKADKVVMVGTGRESTHETIDISRRAADLGADFVSALTPHYFAKETSDEVLVRYYEEVAQSAAVPVLIYNAPQFAAGVQISARAVGELARHPNIVGMKDSSPAGINAFLTATRDNETFHVLAGSSDFFLPALMLGATGGVISMTNYLPEECCKLYDAFVEGRIAEAVAFHHRIFALNKKVTGRGGVPAVKAAMDLMGYRGGAPRRPFAPVDEASRAAIRKALEEYGAL